MAEPTNSSDLNRQPQRVHFNLDDTLYLRRAHTVGHARQHLNLLGYALVVNAVALHRHRRNQAPDRLAA